MANQPVISPALQSQSPPQPTATSKTGANTGPGTSFRPGNSGAFRASDLATRLDSVYLPRQEAALLYAANCLDATSEVLKSYIREPLGKADVRAWHMLLDLYQLTRNSREFSALSMVYGARFQRDAPVLDDERCGIELRRKTARLVRDLFRVKPAADGTLMAEFDHFETFALELGSTRIDLSEVKSMMSAEAELLAMVLARLRAKAIALWINHPEKLIPFLKDRIAGATGVSARGYWELLLEIFIIDGRAHEFDDARLEYAMAFDAAPPAWEKYIPLANKSASSAAPAATKANDSASLGTGYETAGAFRLAGIISCDDRNIVADLGHFALNRHEVTVDMGDVVRIDFDAGGFFFDAIRMLRLTGKRIVLANLNELVAAFLEVFDVQQQAVLVTRMPH